MRHSEVQRPEVSEEGLIDEILERLESRKAYIIHTEEICRALRARRG